MAGERAHWGSRMGFVLAAAGSAVGLGNIWGFPYMAGDNGGGLFVLVYLISVAVIGMPVMMAEIYIGRTTQKSPVGAVRELTRPASPWLGLGWLSVAAAFLILSFYSVVAGWGMHYLYLSLTNGLATDADGASSTFNELSANANLNVLWHVIFMAITIGIVARGVRGGIETCTRVLMPALFLIMIALFVYSMTRSGFEQGIGFVFGYHPDQFDPTRSTLAAMGMAFFSLSLGMGALITYGSYLEQKEDLVTTSITVCVLDTSVALLAAVIFFPILFTAGMDPGQGPGLAFVSLPLAFAGMPGGAVLGPVFFFLLTVAAITSAISLLEVATAYFIDERGWSRARATLTCGLGVMALGVPTALSGGEGFFGAQMAERTGANWFGQIFALSNNYMLPLGGLLIAALVAWRVGGRAREQGFKTGTKLGFLYWGWLQILRYLVPIAVILVFLNALGVFSEPTPVEDDTAQPPPTATAAPDLPAPDAPAQE